MNIVTRRVTMRRNGVSDVEIAARRQVAFKSRGSRQIPQEW